MRILITQLKYSPSPLDYFENCYVSVLRQRVTSACYVSVTSQSYVMYLTEHCGLSSRKRKTVHREEPVSNPLSQ